MNFRSGKWCWYRLGVLSPVARGRFHEWETLEEATMAIVEDRDGFLVWVNPEHICFNDNRPEGW